MTRRHFTWCDDFMAARNAALEHIEADWQLVLDAAAAADSLQLGYARRR